MIVMLNLNASMQDFTKLNFSRGSGGQCSSTCSHWESQFTEKCSSLQ